MQFNRTKPDRRNHHSGKVPFHQRAAKHTTKGEKAPLIAVFDEVYSAEPSGASLAEQMREKTNQVMNEQPESEGMSDLEEKYMLPLDVQIDIITKVVRQKRGTYGSGVGPSFKRPPIPRGGPRNSELKEQLRKAEEEILNMKASFGDRIRVLEDYIARGGSGTLGGNIASDGEASYGNPS